MIQRIVAGSLLLFASATAGAEVTEFCLEGEFDLGARYQGTRPAAGEWYPAEWCVVTEDESERVLFSASGRSNPDLEGDWRVAYLPPDLVRIINTDDPPDIEFRGAGMTAEAQRIRRIDPRRLLEEIIDNRNHIDGVTVNIEEDRITDTHAAADVPLRGRVDVSWHWGWADPDRPTLEIVLDDDPLFRATGRWRNVPPAETQALWRATPGAEPVEVPGENWPSRINMGIEELADHVFLVRGVRTGFRHMVVDTGEGLVVADAPAGWVELHQLPPADLVPGLGISGLSERFIDFLREEWPDREPYAVAVTHFHDDHAGGARAFAAAGAHIVAPGPSAPFLDEALGRSEMPDDALNAAGVEPAVIAVPEGGYIEYGEDGRRVRIMDIGEGPHAYAMLGVWAVDAGYFFVSDIHVPNSEAPVPRAERAPTECWFARWAVDHLPDDVRVVNSHSAPVTPVSRLGEYLESDLCAD